MNKAERGSTFLILMVDDDPMIQNVGKAILEHCGCRVEVSGSGREAVEAFSRKKVRHDFHGLPLCPEWMVM